MAVAAALVALAACSGDGGSSDAPTTTPEPTLATTTTEPSFTGAGSERFCSDDRAARERLDRINQAAPSIETLKERYATLADALRSLGEVAPGEIAGDVRLLGRAYDAFIDSMQRVNWDTMRLPAEVSQKLGSPEVLAASNRLQSYERQVCGIS